MRYRVENPNRPPRWLWIEYHTSSNPRSDNWDDDLADDSRESIWKLDPNKANTDCDSGWDTNDGFEIDYGLNPADFDTDDDGIADGLELDLWIETAGYDPTQPALVPPDSLLWAVSQTNSPAIPPSWTEEGGINWYIIGTILGVAVLLVIFLLIWIWRRRTAD